MSIVAVNVAEYAIGLAAIANVYAVARDLAFRTAVAWSLDQILHPLLWVSLVFFIHILGCVSLHLGGRRESCIEESDSKKGFHRVLAFVRLEFTLSVRQKSFAIEDRQATYTLLFISWFKAMFIVAYLVYGTAILSGTLFISATDSITVFGRFMASAVCCRAVLAYELAALRQVTKFEVVVVKEDQTSDFKHFVTQA